MKALVLASILFFSLRAISAEEGENKKPECQLQKSTEKREPKVLVDSGEKDKGAKKPEPENLSM